MSRIEVSPQRTHCIVHRKCYVYYAVNTANSVNNMGERELVRIAEDVLREILKGFAEVSVQPQPKTRSNHRPDLIVTAKSPGTKIRFAVEIKSRATPLTTLSVRDQILAMIQALPQPTIPVIFAPTISPRVAEILREQGISYADSAGNCWLHSDDGRLLIERQGFRTERHPTPAAADPFSPKSSRIVRALLSLPSKSWKVRELAEDPDVRVSPGLVVKVKRALVEEGYAVERDRRLTLRDPLGLLKAWTQAYSGPAEEVPLYFRGDAAAAEKAISQWCRDKSLPFAAAGFSAAWRLAPEVRYSVAAVYVDDAGFRPTLLDQLSKESGGKRVDTGPNLLLWRPYDESVFAGAVELGKPQQPVTSALQTYLDLRNMAGRGEEAAKAVFDKLLGSALHAAGASKLEQQYGGV